MGATTALGLSLLRRVGGSAAGLAMVQGVLPGVATRTHGSRVPRQNPRAVDGLTVLAGLGLGAVVAQWLVSKPAFTSTPSVVLAVGQLCGLVAAYLALIGVLLAARVPVLETTLGLDRLLRTHRRLGPWILLSMTGHVVLVVTAYTATSTSGPLGELWTIITQYEDVWLAAIGIVAMLVAGIASWRVIRQRMRYEVWWTLHLTMYLGIAAAFLHQLSNGAAFIGHPLAQAAWIGLYLAVAAAVLVYRVGLPLARSLRFNLRVAAIVPEAPDIVSIVLSGRQLDRLPLVGGQYALWRFLTPGLWWQAHPYSLSGLARGGRLRLTVRTTGDHGQELARLRPGIRVLMEGPYGTFTTAVRQPGRRVLLVAGGVGIAPIRTLLEDLPRDAAPVVLFRARAESDLIFREELEWLLAARGGSVSYLVGDRRQQPITPHRLRAYCPDVSHRSIYVCGPESLMSAVYLAARQLGVPSERFHAEAFDFHSA